MKHLIFSILFVFCASAIWAQSGKSDIYSFHITRAVKAQSQPPVQAEEPARTTVQQAPVVPQIPFRSDVDEVPVSNKINDKTFAVIIANENYQNDAPVDYALNDGTIFREYCEKTVGIPSQNIRMVKDATYNNIRTNISWVKDVAQAYKGEAKIIFYYAGHGAPDEAGKNAYLLPVDGDGRIPSYTGYSLDELYSSLASCQTASTLVLMDACFSGARRDGNMLTDARGVTIAPRAADPLGKIVVISAAAGDQVAYKYDSQKHGMFTYFLLKGLQESRGNISLGELSDYLIDNVEKRSIVINSRIQTPTVHAGSEVSALWRNIKF